MASKLGALRKDADWLWEDCPEPALKDDPGRPLAYLFHFLELYSGSAVVSADMSRRGWSVGPAVDIDRSPVKPASPRTRFLPHCG